MSTGWRNCLAIHPACAAYPELPRDELIALGHDIRKHGLQSTSIVVLRTKSKIDGRDEYQLLDGRSRLDAIAAIGIEFDFAQGNRRNGPYLHFLNGNLKGNSTLKIAVKDNLTEEEVRAFIASANLHRRHLTAEEKQARLVATLKAQTKLSNRQIGAITKTDKKKVGAVRAKMEATGEITPVEKRTGKDGKARPAKKRKAVVSPTVTEVAKTATGANTEKPAGKTEPEVVVANPSDEQLGKLLEQRGIDRFFAALQFAPKLKAEIERRVIGVCAKKKTTPPPEPEPKIDFAKDIFGLDEANKVVISAPKVVTKSNAINEAVTPEAVSTVMADQPAQPAELQKAINQSIATNPADGSIPDYLKRTSTESTHG